MKGPMKGPMKKAGAWGFGMLAKTNKKVGRHVALWKPILENRVETLDCREGIVRMVCRTNVPERSYNKLCTEVISVRSPPPHTRAPSSHPLSCEVAAAEMAISTRVCVRGGMRAHAGRRQPCRGRVEEAWLVWMRVCGPHVRGCGVVDGAAQASHGFSRGRRKCRG